MQRHAGTKGAIAETSTPNCRLVFSCGSAAVSGATRVLLNLLLLDETFTHHLVTVASTKAALNPFSLAEAKRASSCARQRRHFFC